MKADACCSDAVMDAMWKNVRDFMRCSACQPPPLPPPPDNDEVLMMGLTGDVRVEEECDVDGCAREAIRDTGKEPLADAADTDADATVAAAPLSGKSDARG